MPKAGSKIKAFKSYCLDRQTFLKTLPVSLKRPQISHIFQIFYVKLNIKYLVLAVKIIIIKYENLNGLKYYSTYILLKHTFLNTEAIGCFP